MYTKIDGKERAGWPAKFCLSYPQHLWKNRLHPVEGITYPSGAESTNTSLPIF